MLKDAIPTATLRRALVIKLRHHGDVLLSAPVFAALKQAAPGCVIDALVYADTRPMLEGHPAIDQIHAIDRNWKKLGLFGQAAAEWRLAAQLRARRYDLVVHLTEHRRGAWIARLCGARWAVAPKRAGGFWRDSFSHLYGQPANARRHMVERNLDALRRIGIQPSAADKRVVLVPGAAAEARVVALLAEHGLAGRGFALLHMASRWLFKCWPAGHVAALADALSERGLAVVLTAAPDAEVLKTRITELNMPQRVTDALDNASIRTVGGLVRKREDDLLSIEGLGQKGLQDIKRALSNLGLTLRSQ